MRLIITCLLVCFLIGGMYAYLEFSDSVVRPAANFQPTPETRTVTAEIKRSATLYADSGFDTVALKVAIKEQTVLEKTESVPANETLVVDLPEVEQGRNTISVMANFEDPEQFLSDARPPSLFAIEVIVRLGDDEIARELFTSSSASLPVGGQVAFDTSPTGDAKAGEQ